MRNGIWVFSIAALCALGSGCKGPTIANVYPELIVTLVDGGALTDGGLYFPLTGYGASSSESFQIQSISGIDLHVSGFVFDGGDFSIHPFEGDGGAISLPLTLPTNATANFTVVFTPTPPMPLGNGPPVKESAGLIIQSDSHTHPDFPVPLAGTAAAPMIDICNTENGNTSCYSMHDSLGVTFARGPVGVTTGFTQLDISDRNDVPLTITAITLDSDALDAGFYITEMDLGLPKVISAKTGLTASFHVALTPSRVCAPNSPNCLTGKVTVTSTDPHYTASNQPFVTLNGTGDPDLPPVACIGISNITYVTGKTVTLDPSLPIDQQDAGVFPPGPLDTATFTALPKPGCSGSPQNLDFTTAFSLTTPDGSFAGFSPAGIPGESSVLFDVTGTYQAYVLVTELADGGFMGGTNLSTADAGMSVVVQPHDELSVVLSWNSATPVGIDLHLTRATHDAGPPPLGPCDPNVLGSDCGLMVSPTNDCFWCNCYLHMGGLCPPIYNNYPDWGQAGLQNTPPDDPLLTSYGYNEEFMTPLNTAVTNVGTLEDATDYDVYVHYYKTQNGADAGCPDGGGSRFDGGDYECTDPDYPFCSLKECVPLVHAQVRVYVGGQEVSGSPNLATFGRICDLWHAGVLHWTTSVDAGTGPVFVFVPTPGISSYYDHNNIPQAGTDTCTLPYQQ